MTNYVVKKEDFFRPEGLAIVCKSQDEVYALLHVLHEAGFVWHDGDRLIDSRPVFEQTDVQAPNMREVLLGALKKSLCNDEEEEEENKNVRNTTALLFGSFALNTDEDACTEECPRISFIRVFDNDYNEVASHSKWILRTPRKLFAKCDFSQMPKGLGVGELIYGDEN